MALSARAVATTYRTYCRPKSEAKDAPLETWEEVCERSVVVHHRNLWQGAGGVVDEQELEELKALQLDRKVTVSGRTLWMGGTEYGSERACSNFNCSFTRVSSVYSVVDAFWLLLNGSGVGFSPQPGTLHGFQRRIRDVVYVDSDKAADWKGFPENVEVAATLTNGFTRTIKIGDSAAAWAKAVGKLVNPPAGRVDKLVLDFSEIRGPGRRLRGYGWICNGWEPLQKAMKAIVSLLNKKAGELLDEIDILDLINHLGTVLSSRRSAEIAILDANHERATEFATAKANHWAEKADGTTNDHRQQSNNSLVFWDRPTKAKIREMMQLIARSGGSEPGFINGVAARRRAPWFLGCNPSLRAGTRVLTRDGVVPIEQLQDKEFYTPNLDGKWSRANCWLSGKNKPLYRIVLGTGLDVYATAEHKWPVYVNGRYVKIETKDLRAGDEFPINERANLPAGDTGTYSEGFVVGYLLGNGSWTERKDGREQVGVTVPAAPAAEECRRQLAAFFQANGGNVTFHPSSNGGESVETCCSDAGVISKLKDLDFEKGRLPKWCWQGGTEAFRRGVVCGLFCADGSVDATTCYVRFGWSSVSEKNAGLLREVAELLGLYGIKMHLRDRFATSTTPNGNTYSGNVWSLRNGGNLAVKHFWKVFRPEERADHATELAAAAARDVPRSRDVHRVKIESVELTNLQEDVWDVTVHDDTHCFTIAQCVTGNCAEILLSSCGFCNLVSIALPLFDGDFASILRAIYLAARANYRQTCVDLRDGVLTNEWHQTNEALRLCGVSLTGIAMCPWITDYQIRRMRDAAVTGAYSMADELGLPRPKLVTTIKPEGTRSKISDVTEGIHTPLGQFVFNSMNYSTVDPVVARCRDAGYEIIPHPTDPNNVLIKFPVDYSGCQFTTVDGIPLNRESAVDQLNRYKRWNTLWADHNSSNTISWDVSELEEIVDWLDQNWDDYVAVSFLFRNIPTKSAKDLGYAYLPQQVVTPEVYREYVSRLKPVDWSDMRGVFDEVQSSDCAGGVCPVK